MPAFPSRPTIDDIALEVKVSKGTVSRVLNGHSTVAAATRQRVEEAVKRLGYVPDPAARHLSWRTGFTLGLWLERHDPMLHPYQVLFRRALEGRMARLGMRLTELQGDLHQLGSLPNAVLIMHAVEGDSRPALLREANIPCVLVGHHPEFFWVAPADEEGGALAAQHLLKLGHRHLAYLGHGPSQVAQDRERGFVQAAQAAGADVHVMTADFGVLDGYRALRRAWEGGLRFTGLFAQSDESAAGAVAALQDLGVQVPQQVSVVGFDGLPEVPLGLQLTTIAQDITAVAQTALDLLQEASSGQPPRGEFIPVSLVPGATSAPLGGLL